MSHKKKRKILYSLLLVLLAVFLWGCHYMGYSNAEIENYVKGVVPEPCSLVRVEKKNNEEFYYFQSTKRNLEFSVQTYTDKEYFTGKGLYCNYWPEVYNLYENDIQKVIERCPCERDTFTFIIKDDKDIGAVAQTLADCNSVLADQLQYTPEADLTDTNIIGIGFNWKFFPNDTVVGYYLNGIDNYDTIYEIILKSK